MNESKHTPGPWDAALGSFGKGRVKQWTPRIHDDFPQPPYEGDLVDEWGVYPPLGECGPVALVAGRENAYLIAAAPDLLAACESAREWLGPMRESTEWGDYYTTLTALQMKLDAAIAAATGKTS